MRETIPRSHRSGKTALDLYPPLRNRYTEKGLIVVPELVKRIDQQRHELKALRFLLQFYPESRETTQPQPRGEDFQIPDCRRIYDTLMAAKTAAEATAAIAQLDLEETDVESFLRLGGEYYHTYPKLVVDRAEQFRNHALRLEAAS